MALKSRGFRVWWMPSFIRELYSVHVCAPQSDKFTSGHSLSLKETVEVFLWKLTVPQPTVAFEISEKFHSGVVAGDIEALSSGVPSISISLNRKKDVSQENDFKDAVMVCLPVINAAIRDLEKGVFIKRLLVEHRNSYLSSGKPGTQVYQAKSLAVYPWLASHLIHEESSCFTLHGQPSWPWHEFCSAQS